METNKAETAQKYEKYYSLQGKISSNSIPVSASDHRRNQNTGFQHTFLMAHFYPGSSVL